MNDYKNYIKKKILLLLIMLIIMIICIIFSINAGSSWINIFDVIKALFKTGDETNILIIYNIRLPRVIGAVVAGFALSISGCIMQTILKNPMASPQTLGVSNASVFGANLAIVLFSTISVDTISYSNPYIVSIFSFIFALASIFIILGISKMHRFNKETIILVGIAIGAVFTALTSIIQYFAIDSQVTQAVYWTFGNLNRCNTTTNLIMFFVTTLSFIFYFMIRYKLNAIEEGEDIANTLGIKVNVIKITCLIISSLITAICVSFLGIIGFVGLIAPQIMKRILGNDKRFLLIASGIAGSILLLISDTIGRIIIPGVSLPVGAITSLIGGPIFLWIIFSKKWRKNYE